MTITVEIIEDSISEAGKRITTFSIRYPRFFHADFMTHRVFSRNASSSRAIPVKKLIGTGFKDMAMPIFWGKNQPGMQSTEESTGLRKFLMKTVWRTSGYFALSFAYIFHLLGAHKQLANRIIEPWTHISVVVTSTEWDNFFALRNHPDAQPELQVLAGKMKELISRNKPKLLKHNEMHLPFVLIGERYKYESDILKKISVARCARVSYLLHDGQSPSVEKDIKLYDRLVGGKPIHASPSEHQAYPDTKTNGIDWDNKERHGNFDGWIQFRKEIEETFL